MSEQNYTERGRHLWAKSAEDGPGHSLLAHLLDVGVTARALLQASAGPLVKLVSGELDLTEQEAERLLVICAALHDIGKATPVFQAKWPEGAPAEAMNVRTDDVPHGRASGILLRDWLRDQGVPRRLAASLANAVAIHHGHRLPQNFAGAGTYDPRSIGEEALPWRRWQKALIEDVTQALGPLPTLRSKSYLRGRTWALLAGLTSVADWIGSSLEHAALTDDLNTYVTEREREARRRLEQVGWPAGRSWWSEPAAGRAFASWFASTTAQDEFIPRPLQVSVEKMIAGVDEPFLLIIEAPMGEGKTEAAFFSIVQPSGAGGAYIALPTQATSDAMHARLMRFVDSHRNRDVHVALAHAASRLFAPTPSRAANEAHPEGIASQAEASSWFARGRRELLAEIGVGTIDQALLGVLPTRHFFVRLWGLAGKVVVVDEVHAYDAYTGGLLAELLAWLGATGASVVLMSATLPDATRQLLTAAYQSGAGANPEAAPAAAYPRLTLATRASSRVESFAATRSASIALSNAPYELPELAEQIVAASMKGGAVGCIVNTVARAQELFERCRAATENVTLLHSRFPLIERKAREAEVVARLGPAGEAANRRGIVIATQVAEQSLDLDFDVLYSDLAPMDLLLQRAGRMHRHEGRERPPGFENPQLLIAGWRSAAHGAPHPDALRTVYSELIMWRTWAVLAHRHNLTLPDDIDPLVQSVYSDAELEPLTLFAAAVEAAGREHRTLISQQARAAEEWALGSPNAASVDSWGESGRDLDDWREYALKVPTRLGDDSVSVVPLRESTTGISVAGTPRVSLRTERGRANQAFVEAALENQIRVSRNSLVAALRNSEPPTWWRRSGPIKRMFPLFLTHEGRAKIDAAVRLDPTLGLVYERR